MNSRFISLNLDFFGFFASLLCAIHCLALPFVLTFGAVGGLVWLKNPIIEPLMIVLSIILASSSLIQSYRKKHGDWTALGIVAVGFGFIIVSRFFEHGTAEHLLTMCGGVCIAFAHWVNWRLNARKSQLA